MKSLAILSLLFIAVQGQINPHGYGYGSYHHDYYAYQGYLPGPPGYVAEVEGDCGCCPPPCCCVCTETSVIQQTTTTTTPIITTTLKECVGLLEICFIVDSSGSIGDDNWGLTLQFLTDVVGRFDVVGKDGIRIGMITYSTNATLHWGLNDPITMDSDSLKEAVNGLELIGSFTNTPEALELANTKCFNAAGDDPAIPNVAIVLTDGRANFGLKKYKQVADELQASARVSAIGVTDAIEMDELELIASDPDDKNVFPVNDYDELFKIFDNLLHEICETISPPPRSTKPPPPTLPPIVEKECFCCCPPPPGYPDGYGNYAHMPGCKCP